MWFVDQRDYICEFCARAFKSSHNLAVHRMIHTGEKPLQSVFLSTSDTSHGHGFIGDTDAVPSLLPSVSSGVKSVALPVARRPLSTGT